MKKYGLELKADFVVFIFDCFIENFNQKHPYYVQEVAVVNCIWDGVI